MGEWVTKYWVQTLFGFIVTCFTFVGKKKFKELECKIKEQEVVKMGMQALLRDRIIQSYNHYIEKDFCPIYAKDNIENLYEQYHALGGNGTVTKLYEILIDLPTKQVGGEGEKKENRI